MIKGGIGMAQYKFRTECQDHLDELKKRYRTYQPELDEYAGLWLIYDNKHSQDIEGPGHKLLAFGTFIEADNYINEMIEGLMESND